MDGVKIITNHGSTDDRKGGGLLLLSYKCVDINLEHVFTKIVVILFVKGWPCKSIVSFTIIYFSVNDKIRILSSKLEKERIPYQNDEAPVTIYGDFNFHPGFLRTQPLN